MQYGVLDGFTITNGVSTLFAGGVSAYESTIRNNVVTGNTGWHGGIAGRSAMVIEDNVVTNNIALGDGGGIHCEPSSCCWFAVHRNRIVNNRAGGNGGGMTIGFGSSSHNVITGNFAGGDGGGLWDVAWLGGWSSSQIYNNYARGFGGGVYQGSDSMILIDSTIVGNTSERGGGGICFENARLTSLVGSIVWNNTGRAFGDEVLVGGLNGSANVTITESIVRGGLTHVTTFGQFSSVHVGPGFSMAAPSFVDEANGDLHLTALSPAVDARSGPRWQVDIDGSATRGRGDMGVDEFAPTVYATGSLTPGGQAVLTAIGPPAAPALLALSIAPRRTTPLVVPGFGDFWLAAPYAVLNLGALPANGVARQTIALPPGLPAPLDVQMQGFVALELTRPTVVEVR